MRPLFLTLAILSACTGGDPSQDDDDDDGSKDPDTATDTDTDSDTDPDSTTDTDTGGGPGELYLEVEVEYAERTFQDSCTGTISGIHSEGAISGSGTCTFNNGTPVFFDDDWGGMLTGTITGDTASGTYRLVSTVGDDIVLDWSGSADGAALEGTLEGATSWVLADSAIPIIYSGTIRY